MIKTNTNSDKRDLILQAAEACILRVGADKTSMDDIAMEAGIGRMTLYRVFSNRLSMLSAVVMRRMDVIAVKVRERLLRAKSFEEAVVEGSVLTIQLATSDKIWTSISKTEDSMHADQLILSRGSLGDEMFLDIWQPVLDMGRENKAIRNELTDEEVGDWIRSIHFLLLHRCDLDEARKARFIRRFALPALK